MRVGRSGDIKNFIPIAITEYDLMTANTLTYTCMHIDIFSLLINLSLYFFIEAYRDKYHCKNGSLLITLVSARFYDAMCNERRQKK